VELLIEEVSVEESVHPIEKGVIAEHQEDVLPEHFEEAGESRVLCSKVGVSSDECMREEGWEDDKLVEDESEH